MSLRPGPPPFMLGPSPRSRKARQAHCRRKTRADIRVRLELARLSTERAMWEQQATEATLFHKRIVLRDEQAERAQLALEKKRRELKKMDPDTREMFRIFGFDAGDGTLEGAQAAAADDVIDDDDLDDDDLAAE